MTEPPLTWKTAPLAVLFAALGAVMWLAVWVLLPLALVVVALDLAWAWVKGRKAR